VFELAPASAGSSIKHTRSESFESKSPPCEDTSMAVLGGQADLAALSSRTCCHASVSCERAPSAVSYSDSDSTQAALPWGAAPKESAMI
jgi:hypothetical protein